MRRLEERIELYLGGKLSKEDVAKFEMEMEGNKQLIREVELQKAAKLVVLQRVKQEQVKQQNIQYFEQIGKDLLDKHYKENWMERLIVRVQGFFEAFLEKLFSIELDPFSSRKTAILAMSMGSILLISVLSQSGILFLQNQVPNPRSNLDYYIDINILKIRSNQVLRAEKNTDSNAVDSVTLMYKRAIEVFNEGSDFQQSKELLLKLQDDKNHGQIRLPLAISYLKTGEYLNAKETLLGPDGKIPVDDEYRWYLILSLIGLGTQEQYSQEICNYIRDIEEQKAYFNADYIIKLKSKLDIKCDK